MLHWKETLILVSSPMPGLSAVFESFSPELEERVRLQRVSSLIANLPGTESWVHHLVLCSLHPSG